MILSGTLREFILADVMQLLTQQKITGKLILDSGHANGHIVFRNGTIVAASREQETFPAKLFYYLTEIQQQPKIKVRELFSSYEGNTSGLTSYLENRGIMTRHELQSYALGVTIDIACSLFLWKSGNYRFDSLRTVDHLIPAEIDIPVENVVMEAMRRIDEWRRMRESITEETIFVLTGKKPDMDSAAGPLENPSLYFYHRIDGISAVKVLLNDSFLTEYAIYESLYSLMQENLIKPLSDSVTRSIRAALQKKEQDKNAATVMPSILSLLVTAGIILIILLLAWFFKNIIFTKIHLQSSHLRNEVSIALAEDHYRDALIYYQTRALSPSIVNDELPSFSSITRKDAFYLSRKRNFDKNASRNYNESTRKMERRY
ncbi:MAG: DUF4388 domain-containing protein [Chitinispirillaceae bacterium]|nr:DUF4388 domain-containing protein [Chitinispirillaceae bacterium]